MDAEGNSPTFPHLKGLKEGDVASSRIKQVIHDDADTTLDFAGALKWHRTALGGVCALHDSCQQAIPRMSLSTDSGAESRR